MVGAVTPVRQLGLTGKLVWNHPLDLGLVGL
jgi:hypothetical protein